MYMQLTKAYEAEKPCNETVIDSAVINYVHAQDQFVLIPFIGVLHCTLLPAGSLAFIMSRIFHIR